MPSLQTRRVNNMNKDRVQDLTNLIDEKIEALINSNDWKEYLKFASAQYRYSWNNQFLIWFQSSVRVLKLHMFVVTSNGKL